MAGNLLTDALGGVTSFVSGWKLYLIAGAAALALLGGTFGAGYLKGEGHAAQVEAKAAHVVASQQVQAVFKQDKLDQTERVARGQRDMTRENELQTQVDSLRTTNSSLQKVLYAKRDPYPDVHLSLGDVRMLNDAAKLDGVGAQGIPDPASVAAYQVETASDVSFRDLQADDLAIRGQYNELAVRHDKLVGWVQVELIDPQTPAASSVKK